jgi:hypothetical protein
MSKSSIACSSAHIAAQWLFVSSSRRSVVAIPERANLIIDPSDNSSWCWTWRAISLGALEGIVGGEGWLREAESPSSKVSVEDPSREAGNKQESNDDKECA